MTVAINRSSSDLCLLYTDINRGIATTTDFMVFNVMSLYEALIATLVGQSIGFTIDPSVVSPIIHLAGNNIRPVDGVGVVEMQA